jgi:hypothetical protein
MTRDQILERYRHLREISTGHHSGALKFLPRQALLEHAKRLGLAIGGMLVAESEAEMTLVFDLALYTAKEGRSRALDRYARATPLPPGSGPHAGGHAPRPVLSLAHQAAARGRRADHYRRAARGRGVAG